jgi:K+-sensing histidine kinase KdpD
MSLAATAARVLLDPVLGDTHPFATFYVVVVLAAWYGGVGPSLLTLVLGTLAAMYLFIPPRNSFEVRSISDRVALGVFVFVGSVTTVLCESLRAARHHAESRLRQLEHEAAERRRVEEEREALIGQLRGALNTVKTLRGLLPLCAWCKSIRNDRGYWEQLETYLGHNLDVDFTHGICPQCAEKLWAEAHAPTNQRAS